MGWSCHEIEVCMVKQLSFQVLLAEGMVHVAQSLWLPQLVVVRHYGSQEFPLIALRNIKSSRSDTSTTLPGVHVPHLLTS